MPRMLLARVTSLQNVSTQISDVIFDVDLRKASTLIEKIGEPRVEASHDAWCPSL